MIMSIMSVDVHAGEALHSVDFCQSSITRLVTDLQLFEALPPKPGRTKSTVVPVVH